MSNHGLLLCALSTDDPPENVAQGSMELIAKHMTTIDTIRRAAVASSLYNKNLGDILTKWITIAKSWIEKIIISTNNILESEEENITRMKIMELGYLHIKFIESTYKIEKTIREKLSSEYILSYEKEIKLFEKGETIKWTPTGWMPKL